MPTNYAELISGAIAFLLTISVLSYLLGDNFFFRASIYVFVGVSAGYVAAVVLNQVLIPQLIQPIISGNSGEKISSFIALFLAFLLLLKAFPPLSKLGTPSIAFMVGVGAAVAITGAITGTLFPQISAAINALDLEAAQARGATSLNQFLNGTVMIFGTVSTLIYFQFSAKKQADGKYSQGLITKIFSYIGKFFIAVTFGVLFAGVFSAALTAFIERIDFLISFIFKIIENFT